MINLTPTPHIEATKNDIAKIVIMPGDPLRAKYIAEKYLSNVKQVNKVRNMFMYTGEYQGTKITIAGSGMGMPSIGIYSYELFKFYDVDCIIRVGSAGSYQKTINLYDVINVKNTYSESTFARVATHGINSRAVDLVSTPIIASSSEIYEIINNAAAIYDKSQKNSTEKINLKTGTIHSNDVFYHLDDNYYQKNESLRQCLGVEMESFALFTNAILLNKTAGCILTISDSLITKATLSSEKRQTSFNKMIILALNAAKQFQQKVNS